MSIEFVRCPYCHQDVEVNPDHEVDVCACCYEVIQVKDVLKKRRMENILSHAPGAEGEKSDPAAEMMTGCFWKYTKTMDETHFNAALEHAETLLGKADTAEEQYAATNLIADTGARAVAALIDRHCLDILAANGLYDEELLNIGSRMDAIDREIESKNQPFSMNPMLMLQIVKKPLERKLQKQTEEINQRRTAKVDAVITEAMDDVLRYYEKLTQLVCTDSLLEKIADLGYGLQMSEKHRKAFEEIFEREYGKYKARELLFEQTCREAWPELPAEITGWLVERRQEDGAILITISRTVSAGVRSMTYELLPMDEKGQPLFSKPVHFIQDAFSKDRMGRVESTNKVCSLPAIPSIRHVQIRIKTVYCHNGMAFTARENAKEDVNPAALDIKTKTALMDIGGEGACCLPYRDEKVWRCICGKYNTPDRAECLCCTRNQDNPLNTLNAKDIEDRARAIRVDEQNRLLKPYQYKGIACRCGDLYYSYSAREGRYDAPEALKAAIGDDLPICTGLDAYWFTYIDARSGIFKAIDLSTGAKLAPYEHGVSDMAYEEGVVWLCGEELAALYLQSGRMQAVYPARAKKPLLHRGIGYFLDDEDRLQAVKIGEDRLNMLAKDVRAFAVDGDTLYMAAGDRILCARVSTAKGMKLMQHQVLARDADAEKLALDEAGLYYYTRYLGKASIHRLERKGGKTQKGQTVYQGVATCLFTDQGKAYALTNQNELLCLTEIQLTIDS